MRLRSVLVGPDASICSERRVRVSGWQGQEIFARPSELDCGGLESGGKLYAGMWASRDLVYGIRRQWRGRSARRSAPSELDRQSQSAGVWSAEYHHLLAGFVPERYLPLV